MNWKQFSEKYSHYKDEFNGKSLEERSKISQLMYWEAIRELIRSKEHLEKAISEINKRIKTLSEELD